MWFIFAQIASIFPRKKGGTVFLPGNNGKNICSFQRIVFYLDTLYPLGQVPVLVLEDGEVIAQSHAIVRYLASEFDLYGKSSHDRVIIDQTLDTLKNVEENLFGSYFWTKDPEAKVCDSTSLFFFCSTSFSFLN